MARRSGIGAFLASLRITFNNPLTRAILRYCSREVLCKYNVGSIKAPIINYALASYAGESVECPLSVEATSLIIRSIIATGVRLMGGDPREVAEALRDPAVRRGIARGAASPLKTSSRLRRSLGL